MTVMLSILVGISLLFFLLLNYYPVFGGKPSKGKISKFKQSLNYSQNKFHNQIATPMHMDVKTLFTIIRDFMNSSSQRNPDRPLPMVSIDPISLQEQEHTKVIWFGHSTILLAIEGKKVLIDPMFSSSASPFPIVGAKRYSATLPIEIEKLPFIDIVILSHDHYDHLDYDSIMKLKDKVSQFYVPLGLGSHLEKWGIENKKIREHDWWNESEFEGLRLVSTPARHFSGRSLFDRDATLWCSWVIIGKQSRVYYSGDGGYGPHFAQIGKKYGPFDLTLMECGQYDKRWSAIHMLPEETIQAHMDVKGHVIIPIHWAAFSLAVHDWTDSIERVTKAAQERHIPISTPKIGEAVLVGTMEYPNSIWWK